MRERSKREREGGRGGVYGGGVQHAAVITGSGNHETAEMAGG